jgi:transposase
MKRTLGERGNVHEDEELGTRFLSLESLKETLLVDVLKDVTAESILNLTIKTVRRRSIVYTDKFKSYDSLMVCGYRHLKIDHSKRFSTGKVYINGLEGSWSYAKERLIKYHGVSKEKFPLYLKEMEYRCNNRHKNMFNLLA